MPPPPLAPAPALKMNPRLLLQAPAPAPAAASGPFVVAFADGGCFNTSITGADDPYFGSEPAPAADGALEVDFLRVRRRLRMHLGLA